MQQIETRPGESRQPNPRNPLVLVEIYAWLDSGNVDFVVNHQLRHLTGADFLKYPIDRFNFFLARIVRAVDHVQD